MDWLDVRDLKEREKNNGRGMEWAVGQEVSYPHVVGVRVARFGVRKEVVVPSAAAPNDCQIQDLSARTADDGAVRTEEREL